MTGYRQQLITNAAFTRLASLTSLTLRRCAQPTITDAILFHMPLLKHLDMSYYPNRVVSERAFAALSALTTSHRRWTVATLYNALAAFKLNIGLQMDAVSAITHPLDDARMQAQFAFLVACRFCRSC